MDYVSNVMNAAVNIAVKFSSVSRLVSKQQCYYLILVIKLSSCSKCNLFLFG